VIDPLHVFMPYGPEGPSARVRVYAWLRRLDLEAKVHPYLGRATAGAGSLLRRPVATLRAEAGLWRAGRRRGIRVLVHREVSPLSNGEVEIRIMDGARFSVYDLDDALQWDWADEGGFRRLVPKAKKTITCVRRADRVIAANDILAEWASAWAREVVIIPSCVDPAAYPAKDSYELSDPPRLGWIGTRATEQYLRGIEEPLLEVHRRTGARLEVVSRGHLPLNSLEAITDRVEWSEQAGVAALARWDVGLMPLAPGLLERGKSGYKLLQYGAAGLPAVGSPVGVNTEILGQMGAPAARSDSEWVDALVDLLEAPAERRRDLGMRGRRLVSERYSYGAWAPRWREAVAG
jgi:glycosyltransferase involved in cell wall biosynthesis